MCPADPPFFAGAQSYESWGGHVTRAEINRSVDAAIDRSGFGARPAGAYHRSRSAGAEDAVREHLYTAIRAAARGETALAPAVASRLVGRMRLPAAVVAALERGIIRLPGRTH